MAQIQDKKFGELGLQKAVSSKHIVSYHHALDKASDQSPILVLLHGYPQSSYIWRHLIPLLQNRPLFASDLPGYGLSAPADKHDKISWGVIILEALKEILGYSDTLVPIVIIGHDRGARVAHLLHLSKGQDPVLGFRVLGLAILDIVPTLSQWQIGDTAAAQTGYFHWSFLANVALAKDMIMAYGGGKWANAMIERWSGTNSKGLERLRSGDAMAVYKSFFDQESVVEASCRDYESGATVDLDIETKATSGIQRITVPLLLVYSKEFLPRRAKKPIAEVWGPPWSEHQGLITDRPLGDGIGHFVAEEAPELTAEAILEWLPSLQT